MVMPMFQSLVTADDLARMPDDNYSYELVEGRLVRMSKSGVVHSLCSGRIYRAVAEHADKHGLGLVLPQDAGFSLRRNPDTVRAPDVGFISEQQIRTTELPEGFWPGAPDLVVEVISPNDRRRAVDHKAREWLASGARLVWVVDVRRRTVSVHRTGSAAVTLTHEEELNGEDVLPGFRLPLTTLFEGLPYRREGNLV
ncbi:MAG: Uma2 family endonuclease [Luteitalea sp.]|nr:Uma2 family endonuclease [Luteitalea sp.]